jgi:hypothetical protein
MDTPMSHYRFRADQAVRHLGSTDPRGVIKAIAGIGQVVGYSEGKVVVQWGDGIRDRSRVPEDELILVPKPDLSTPASVIAYLLED